MLTTELKFAANCLMKWFSAKFKSQNIYLSNDAKRKYKNEHPIDKQTTRCCICKFPFEINPTMSDAAKDQMSYSDFIISKKHKFLRNIFSREELSTTSALKDFSSYHERFSKFLHIATYLQTSLDIIQEFFDCDNEELLEFCLNFCADCNDFAEIKKRISIVELKTTPKIQSKNTIKNFKEYPQTLGIHVSKNYGLSSWKL